MRKKGSGTYPWAPTSIPIVPPVYMTSTLASSGDCESSMYAVAIIPGLAGPVSKPIMRGKKTPRPWEPGIATPLLRCKPEGPRGEYSWQRVPTRRVGR